MSDLMAARAQMAMSLGFHIIFAAVGMAMPLMMVLAEWRSDRTLAQRWAKGTAVLFAVGAVSGTVLSFELGLLWPTFMQHAGPIIGMPFSLEGFAFFLEAIALGIYLYGWERVSRPVHLAAGVVVLISGIASALFVICANGWMNTPQGFALRDGVPVAVDPWAAMFNPAALPEGVHMVLAAFAAVGFAVAGVHAALWLRGRGSEAFHRRALDIAMGVGGVAALLQPLAGDFAAKMVAKTQPIKLAAMEAHWDTERRAPLRLGGVPDSEAQVTRYALELPGALSMLAHGDFDAEVRGLKDFPAELHPPIAVVHYAFQVMVGAGMAMLGVALLYAWRRKRMPRWLLRALVLASPLGFVAIEAGWTVTEVGRQPWIIQGVMRTRDAVTQMPQLQVPFITFTLLYIVLAATVVVLLKNIVFRELP